MKKATTTLLLTVTFLLSSCATMSTKECKSANWHDIGHSDAKKGKRVQLSGHRDACAKVKVQPNKTLYMAGYRTGEKEFCNYENGLRFGKKGRSSRNLCTTSALGRDFSEGYKIGKNIYRLDTKIKKRERELDKIDRKLTKIRKKKLKSSVREIDLLYREKEIIKREIRSLRREIRRAR